MDQIKGHPYFAKPTEMVRTKKNFYMVQEFTNGGGSLRELMERNGGKLPENDVKPLIQRIIEAVSYLFSIGLFNKDVNLDKLLLHFEEEE